jgi:2'-5' RNA ligase
VRAFLAVAPDPRWAEGVGEWLDRVRASLPPASWTRAGTWHLTLRFFAEISEQAASRFSEELGPQVAATAAADLVTDGATALPPRGRPRVLAVGFAPSPGLAALTALAASAEVAARAAGAPAEERAFYPHVTLARIRRPWPPPAITAFREAAAAQSLPAFQMRSIVLYRSRLEPAGPVHSPLREWRLGAQRVEVRA